MSGERQYPEEPGLYYTQKTGLPPRAERPGYPYKLEVRLWFPVSRAWAVIYGTTDEYLVAQAQTLALLEAKINESRLRTHPRLILLVLTGPGGEIERIERQGVIHPFMQSFRRRRS